jgi:hypothetical protein
MLQTCDVGICVEEESSWCWMLHATWVTTWSQYSRNMGGEGRKTLDVGCCMPRCSQHATHKLATLIITSFVECCKHDGSQHGKRYSQHRKSCSQHLYASQYDRRLIRSLIWIVQLRTRPMLAPGSDVRALAAPIIKTGNLKITQVWPFYLVCDLVPLSFLRKFADMCWYLMVLTLTH